MPGSAGIGTENLEFIPGVSYRNLLLYRGAFLEGISSVAAGKGDPSHVNDDDHGLTGSQFLCCHLHEGCICFRDGDTFSDPMHDHAGPNEPHLTDWCLPDPFHLCYLTVSWTIATPG